MEDDRLIKGSSPLPFLFRGVQHRGLSDTYPNHFEAYLLSVIPELVYIGPWDNGIGDSRGGPQQHTLRTI